MFPSNQLFPRQLGRLGWIWRFVVVMAVAGAVIITTDSLRPHDHNALYWVLEIFGWAVVVVAVVYSFAFVHLPRLRDLGLGRAFLILLIIPYLNIVVLCVMLIGKTGAGTEIQAKFRPKDD